MTAQEISTSVDVLLEGNSNIAFQKQPSSTHKRTRCMLHVSLLLGLLSGLFFSLSGACVKFLTHVDPGQVALYQYVAITAFSLPMIVYHKLNVLGPTKSSKYWMLLCGILDALTIYFSYVSFRYIPLSDATVLTSSVPVFVTITARIFLKESCGYAQIFAIVISVMGVGLVAKVPLLMANRTEVYTKESAIGVLASFAAIAAESGTYVLLRKLQNVDASVILFNFGCVATLVNVGITACFGYFSPLTCGPEGKLAIGVGVFSFLSQLSITKALEIENAGPVSVLMAAGDIMMAFILDTTLFSELPDLYTIGGTILVVTSVIIVGFKARIDIYFKKYFTKK